MSAVAPVIVITIVPFPIHAVGAVVVSAETAIGDLDTGFFLVHAAYLTFFHIFLSFRGRSEGFRQTGPRDRQ